MTPILILRFDPRDLAAIRDGTFVHNHPPYVEFAEGDRRRRAGSFSPLDLVFMYEVNLAHARLVTAERTYFLSRLPSGFFLDPDEIFAEYERLARHTRARLGRQAPGELPSDESEAGEGAIADAVMNHLAAYYDYRWEEAT